MKSGSIMYWREKVMNDNIFEIDDTLLALAKEAEEECAAQFRIIDEIAEYNGMKVLKAFMDNRVSEGCLKGTTGYGYSDIGREAADKVFAQAFGGEDAIVRHTFVNGTHALSTALFGVLRPGDLMLACTGRPYDTLEEVIGIRYEKGNGSLKDFGVEYAQADLLENGMPDLEKIKDESIEGMYCQDFWNYPMFKTISDMMKKPRPVGTMGLVIDTEHPALSGFASKKYSTPQWFEIVNNSRSVILDDRDEDINVIVRTIDNVERNHSLSLLYEYEKDGGKVVVCSCDIEKLADSPEGRAFVKSLFDYVRN